MWEGMDEWGKGGKGGLEGGGWRCVAEWRGRIQL